MLIIGLIRGSLPTNPTTNHTKHTKQDKKLEEQNLITFFHPSADRLDDGDLALLDLLRRVDSGV